MIRNFAFYSEWDVYNPMTPIMKNGVEFAYFAIEITRADGVEIIPVPMGDYYPVDVTGYVSVKAIGYPKDYFNFRGFFRTDRTRELPYTPTYFEFAFSSAMIDFDTSDAPRLIVALSDEKSNTMPLPPWIETEPEPEPEPEPTFDYKVTQAFLDFGNSKNFDAYYNDAKLILNDTLNYPFTIVYKARNGFKFDTFKSPYGGYDPVLDDMVDNPTIFNENNTTATINYDNTDIKKLGVINDYDIGVSVYEPETSFDLEITQAFLDHHSTRNTTVKINDEIMVLGSKVEYPMYCEVIANTGYIFESEYNDYDVDEGISIRFTLSDDGTTLTRNFRYGYNYSAYNIVPVAVEVTEPEPTFDYKVTQSFIDDLASKKATLYINDNQAQAGDEYNLPYDARIEIENTHYATRYNSRYYNTVEGDYLKFNHSPDFKTLTKTLTIAEKSIHDEPQYEHFYSVEGYYIETAIDETVIVPDKVAYNDVFVLTDEQAREIATTQFTYFKNNNGLAPTTPVPQGENIISFIKLPFIVPDELYIGSKSIQIGQVNSGLTAPYLNIDVYAFDMGVISVPDDKQNFTSFDKTSALLHLPYSNPIVLDIDYVIGQEIGVVYNVNLYDGVASVNITSSKIGGVIDTKSIKLNINIPFGKPDDNPSDNSPRNIDFGINNGVLRPYIEILRYDAILENGFFTIPIVDETLLIEQSGFIKIDEVDLKVKASKDEKEMILTAINQGVIIK